MSDDAATTIHEAGHAIAAEAIGRGWLRVSIGAAAGLGNVGETHYADRGEWQGLDRAFVALAGVVAQQRAVGHTAGCQVDVETASASLRARYGPRADLAGIFRTMTLLVNLWLDRRDVWNRIENLAARLLEQKQVLANEPASQQAAACVPTALVDVRYLATERASWATWRDSARRGTSRGAKRVLDSSDSIR